VSVFVVDPHFSGADLRSWFSGAVEMHEQKFKLMQPTFGMDAQKLE